MELVAGALLVVLGVGEEDMMCAVSELTFDGEDKRRLESRDYINAVLNCYSIVI